MAKDRTTQYTVTAEALEGMLSDQRTKMEILHYIFDNEDHSDRDLRLILCELCILHKSMIKYIELIKKTPVPKEDKYLINSQDLMVMNTIKTGCKELERELQDYNMHLAVN